MWFGTVDDLIKSVQPKQYMSYKHGKMWVFADEDYIATGKDEEEAMSNFRKILEQELEKLNKKVEQDFSESRRKFNALWNLEG